MTSKCLIDISLLDDCSLFPVESYSANNRVYDGETGYHVSERSSRYSDWSEYEKWVEYFQDLISNWEPDPNTTAMTVMIWTLSPRHSKLNFNPVINI